MQEQTLTEEEVKSLFNIIELNDESIFISNTVFLENHPSVAIVGRVTQRKLSLFETVFLIWKSSDGRLHRRKVADSREEKEYINIRRVWIEENTLHINLATWGVYLEAWEATWKYSIHWLN